MAKTEEEIIKEIIEEHSEKPFQKKLIYEIYFNKDLPKKERSLSALARKFYLDRHTIKKYISEKIRDDLHRN